MIQHKKWFVFPVKFIPEYYFWPEESDGVQKHSFLRFTFSEQLHITLKLLNQITFNLLNQMIRAEPFEKSQNKS